MTLKKRISERDALRMFRAEGYEYLEDPEEVIWKIDDYMRSDRCDDHGGYRVINGCNGLVSAVIGCNDLIHVVVHRNNPLSKTMMHTGKSEIIWFRNYLEPVE